jgi:diguanylate cyclase (GGDEF)-like protein/PAS domain S-box-containing protein
MHATNLKNLTLDETRKQLQDLQEHLFDLEAQVEEFRPVKNHHEASNAYYFNRYDLAPMGYVNFAIQGVSAVHVAMHDMTERKRVQTARNESELRWKFALEDNEEELRLAASVFTNAFEGILITSADGVIVDVNQSFTRITGYSRGEVIGRNPRLLSSSRHQTDFFVSMWRDLIETGYWRGEIWNRRKDGRVYTEMQSISAVRDVDGQVQHYVALYSDISQLKEREFELEQIAHFDALTGLPNRVLLTDRLHQAMVLTQRRDTLLAVVFLDLDGFKAINDQHGHEAGDLVLIALASRLKCALRDGDTFARLGGDEFVAVLPDLANVEASLALLKRMLSDAAGPVHIGKLVLRVSASVGVTFYPQTEEVSAEQLLAQADHAMYQAKLAGKNRYQIFARD